MRLYLLPVSTRRTLLYANRLNAASHDGSLVDRGAAFAARKWAQWEKMERGWQRKVVDYGNQAFRRIPFEEWGLKSVPPLSARRRDDELRGRDPVQLVFPPAAIPGHKAEGWCGVPNLPFFYLVYRAWSHWRAINGGKHIQWLLQHNLLHLAPSKELDQLYTKDGQAPADEPGGKEQMLITQKQIQDFSETLDLPAVEIELERAIWQVERALGKEQEQEQEQQTEKTEKTSEEKDKQS
ncbi:hypothetical protein TrVFT333_001514 [Trichoderma virens FT-333]|nr:hypothetical protein TrVFT333_001514 [Trichoderma virens FT-333]